MMHLSAGRIILAYASRRMRTIGQLAPMLLTLAVATSSLAAQKSEITGLTIVSETINQIVVDVHYRYLGEHGNEVYAQVLMADDGQPSNHYGVSPARVKRGDGIARVKLSTVQSAPKLFSTSQLIVGIHEGGRDYFLQEIFSFPKTWAKSGASLSRQEINFKHISPGTTSVPLTPTTQEGTIRDQGNVERLFLQDGTVELRFPDGRIVQRSKIGEITIWPDGTRTGKMFVEAPSGALPSGPPTSSLRNWLSAEGDRLLEVMRILVGPHQGTITNYLASENVSASPYSEVHSRISAIDKMLRP